MGSTRYRSKLLKLSNSWRLGPAIAALLLSFGPSSAVWAVDVPFRFESLTTSYEGVAKLENGQLTAVIQGISLQGDVEDGVLSVVASGNLMVGWYGNQIASGSDHLAAGKITILMFINRQDNPPPAHLYLDVPASALAAAAPVTAPAATSTLPALDMIDATYVAVNPAKIREKPDPLSARIRTIEVGQKINVVGRLKGQDWYLVSENDQPLGYVVVDQLMPESQFASVASSASLAAGETGGAGDVTKLNFGHYSALVIGNNNYRNGLQSLKTAAGDARAVAQALQAEYGFKVTLLTDATRAQVLEALTRLRRTLTADDNLLIYYAGHGSYDQAGDQGYWLPVDAKAQDPTNWISNADITTMLKAIQARHIMVVADSCYSGSLTRDANADIRDASYLTRIVAKKARTVLTSGGLEPVADAGGGGHSVFAAAFLATLAANTGVMDAETFFERVRKPVILAASQTPEYSNLRSAGHEGGDFVFVRK